MILVSRMLVETNIAFDSIEDLLAESDGDEYVETDFEVKSEKK